jgi:hypothetical protein
MDDSTVSNTITHAGRIEVKTNVEDAQLAENSAK